MYPTAWWVRTPIRSMFEFVTLRRFFFFNDTATTEIYTLSLHDALPIWHSRRSVPPRSGRRRPERDRHPLQHRSEEHTSELQSQSNIVCRLLLAKKNLR